MKVLDLSSRPEATPGELIEILEADQGLTHRILDVANSPFHSPTETVHTVADALSVLGTSAVTSLALTWLVRDACLEGHKHPLADSFWRQSVVKAVAAEVLCGQVREGLECEYFLAGLLLDVGRFALLCTAASSYMAAMDKSRNEFVPCWQVEQATLGITSAQIGARLIEHWGLPGRLVRGIQLQFSARATFEEMDAGADCPLCSALALSSAIGEFYCGEQPELAWSRIQELTTGVLPMSEGEVSEVLARISRRFSIVAPVLKVSPKDLPDAATLRLNAEQNMVTQNDTPAAVPEVAADSPEHRTVERRGFTVSTANPNPRTFRDPLTLVFTREFFEETLHKEVQRCRQLAAPLGVAFVEVDRLQELTAHHGESFGDVVLKRVGGLLKDLLRSSDTIARFSNQFAILASDPTAKGMQRLADRIRGRIAGESMIWSGQSVPLTVSVGATLALPERTDQGIAPQVIAAAQHALQEAARGEGNNIYFDSLVGETELQRLFMSNQFRFSRWLIAQGVLDIPRVGKALLEFRQRPVRIGELALRQELLNARQLEQILEDQEESQARFGEIAVRRKFLTEDQLVGLLILQQEDPLRVAELFLRLQILDQNRLQALLKEYFTVVPWAAPLYPAAKG